MDVDTQIELRKDLREMFRKFYADKYSDEESELILDDLIRFIGERYIEALVFCAYEKGADNIGTGYELRFGYSGVRVLKITRPDLQEIPRWSEGTEKLVLLKLSDSFMQLSADKQREFIFELRRPWEYFGDVAMNSKNHGDYFQASGLEVRIGEIHGEANR